MSLLTPRGIETNLTTPTIGTENSQNLYKPRVQWIYLLAYRGHVEVTDQLVCTSLRVQNLDQKVTIRFQTVPEVDDQIPDCPTQSSPGRFTRSSEVSQDRFSKTLGIYLNRSSCGQEDGFKSVFLRTGRRIQINVLPSLSFLFLSSASQLAFHFFFDSFFGEFVATEVSSTESAVDACRAFWHQWQRRCWKQQRRWWPTKTTPKLRLLLSQLKTLSLPRYYLLNS